MEKHLSLTTVLVCTLSTFYEAEKQMSSGQPGQVLPCALVRLIG
jgi:hypothetical protein